MPDETVVQPEGQPPEQTEQISSTPAPTLPDVDEGEAAKNQEKEEVEKAKSELSERLKKTESEKESLEKRLKDNQEYISRTRNAEKVLADQVKPQKTFEEYEREVLSKFEDDPKAGLQRILRDVAYDRDLERKEMDRKLVEVEDRAIKKMLAVDPERGKIIRDVEKFDEDAPDMAGLSFERKIEIINLRNAAKKPSENDGRMAREKVSRERDMASEVGASRTGHKSERIPAWLNDPEVLREADGKFTSKQELLDWSNSDKARQKYEEMRRRNNP